mmetsp:Transcript_48980/g.158678  ORF Transcript_48980/g.158678 Transcript_48980/m.158678 type:complete len:269 (+) Transcript_48980:900-1706(+)
MSTTARKKASTGLPLEESSVLTATHSGTNSGTRASMPAASVVSTTAKATWTGASALPSLNCLRSPSQSAYADMPARVRLFALNCCAASRFTSATPVYCTSRDTILRSQSVVVGERRLSVSERIACSSSPPTSRGIGRCSTTKECAMMVDMEPHGRMSTKIGRCVTIVDDCSAWWSMTPTILEGSIAGCSCVVCWKSTRQTRALSPCSSRSCSTGLIRLRSMPHVASANSVSLLISEARAGTPPYKAAAPIAPATLSRSATRWPQKIAP